MILCNWKFTIIAASLVIETNAHAILEKREGVVPIDRVAGILPALSVFPGTSFEFSNPANRARFASLEDNVPDPTVVNNTAANGSIGVDAEDGSDPKSTIAAISIVEKAMGATFTLAYNSLPKAGKASKTPWPSNFFPTYKDGINDSNNTESAAAKYAKAFGMDPTELELSVTKASGIERQRSLNRVCTTNNECTQYKDGSVCAKRKGQTSGLCIATWFGLCHAWGPASIMEEEPDICPVVVNGVKFGVMDIKALLIQSYDQSKYDTIFTSRRCNDLDPQKDQFGRYVKPECRDMTPDFFHLSMANLLGKYQRSFVVDVTANVEVWNQPVISYEMTDEKISKNEAENRVFPNAGQSFFIDAAVDFVAVNMTMHYIAEGASEFPFISKNLMGRFVVPKNYQYVLGLDSQGRIVDGEWLNGSKVDHPDFLWLPSTSPAPDSTVAGGIVYKNVVDLLKKSRECLTAAAAG